MDKETCLTLAESLALGWQGRDVDPWGWQVSSPTQRSLAKLRKEWPLVAITERWNPFAKVRQDLWGFVDVLCCRQDSLLAVQTTSGSNVSARYEKISLLPSVVHWLSNPACRLVIHGWAVRGKAGKRKLWTCRECEVVLNETGKPIIREP